MIRQPRPSLLEMTPDITINSKPLSIQIGQWDSVKEQYLNRMWKAVEEACAVSGAATCLVNITITAEVMRPFK